MSRKGDIAPGLQWRGAVLGGHRLPGLAFGRVRA